MASDSWVLSFRLILGFAIDYLLLVMLFVFRLGVLGFVDCCLF